MKAILSLAALAVAGSLACAPAFAQVKHGSKDEAQALAKKAVAHYKSAGRDKAFPDFSQKGGPFTDRDLYVFVTDVSGKTLAHGANEKLIGRDMLALKDADGKAFVVEFVDRIKSGKAGWTDYKWPNPVSKEIEAKTTYCEPHDNMVFCVGAYK